MIHEYGSSHERASSFRIARVPSRDRATRSRYWCPSALPITSERLVAAVPFDHPLAKRKRTNLVEISAFPIVCMPEGTAPRTMFDQACASGKIKPDIVLQASAPDAVADLAARGLGVAVLTESMSANHAARLKALELDDIPEPVGLALVWTTAESPALREFLQGIHDAFKDPRSRRVIRTGGREAQEANTS